jgi:hypothetical protein
VEVHNGEEEGQMKGGEGAAVSDVAQSDGRGRGRGTAWRTQPRLRGILAAVAREEERGGGRRERAARVGTARR